MGWAPSRASNPIVGIFALSKLFDSTRGFPGEGPPGPAPTPWFLDETSTRHLYDRKRRFTEPRLEATIARPEGRRLTFGSSHQPRQAPQVGNGNRRRSDTALGRFLQSQDLADAKAPSTRSAITPVPRELSPQVPVFSTPRKQRDFLTPLPFVSADRSLRQEFIKHYGGLRGMDSASFDEIWKVTKTGIIRPTTRTSCVFARIFFTHSPSIRFNPTGIQPGDLVGFLRREHERGAAHPSLKDAAASVSTACAQASDGLAQLGSQTSDVSFLKYVKQHEAPDKRERMIIYPDVARLIQIAWEFGPNANLNLEQLKRKLVILLMVDTAARPSDIWRLNSTLVVKYRQIEFLGNSDARIRYYWPKEVHPFSSRTNATNTWFSQWVVIKGTEPSSTDTVACLREFLQRSSNPGEYAPEYIAQIAASVQPLIFARTKEGLCQKCSVDHISNIVKKAISQAGIITMKPRHLRGASSVAVTSRNTSGNGTWSLDHP